MPAAKKPAKKSKGGRPPKVIWNSEKLRQAESLAGYGLTEEMIADFFDMSRRGFQDAANRVGNLKSAIVAGRAKAAAIIARKAYDLAASGEVPAMTMFWLKTRLRWRETDRVENVGEDGGPIKHEITVKYVRPRKRKDD